MSSPRIVEFEGMAGCGKSTICRKLRETLPGQGRPVIWLTEKPFRSYLSATGVGGRLAALRLFSFRAAWRALCFWLGAGRLSRYKFCALLCRTEAVYRHFLRHGAPGALLVCDQSLIQTLVAVWGYDARTELTGRERKAVSRFLKAAPVSDHFLCALPAEEHVRRIRLRGRSGGRLDQIRDDRLLLEKLANNEHTLSQVVALQEAVRPEIRLDMRKDPDTLAEEVMTALDGVPKGGRSYAQETVEHIS